MTTNINTRLENAIQIIKKNKTPRSSRPLTGIEHVESAIGTITYLTGTASSATSIGSSTAAIHHNQREITLTSGASNFWAIGDPVPNILWSLFWAGRLASESSKGKRGRFRTIAYALGVVFLLSTLAMILTILAALGSTVGMIMAPFAAIAMSVFSVIRNFRRWRRTRAGLDREELLKQKLEKVEISIEAGAYERAELFAKECLVLDYLLYLDKPTNERIVPTETIEKPKSILTTSDTVETYHRYFLWLKQQANVANENRDPDFETFDENAKTTDKQIRDKQSDKYRWRRNFLIVLGILALAAIFASFAVIMPFFLPGIAAVALAFSIIGIISGTTMLGTGIAAGIMSSIYSYRAYQAFRKRHEKDNPELVKNLGRGLVLQITGISLFSLSIALVGAAFLPFINVAALAIIGSIVLTASITLMVIGIYKAWKANKEAQKTVEPKTEGAITPSLAPVSQPKPQVQLSVSEKKQLEVRKGESVVATVSPQPLFKGRPNSHHLPDGNDHKKQETQPRPRGQTQT